MGALVASMGVCVVLLGLVCLNLLRRISRLENGIQAAAERLREHQYE